MMESAYFKNRCLAWAACFVLTLCLCSPKITEPFNQGGDEEKTHEYSRYLITEQFNMPLTYALAVPVDWNASRSYPLVLALHYGGADSYDYCADFLNLSVLPGLSELDAIFLAPNCLFDDGWLVLPLETAVMNCISALQTRYNIDPHRMLVMGFSMGGIGTWYYTARHQDLFSIGMPIAGTPVPEAFLNTPEIPMYVIHGENDLTFPIEEVQPFVEQMQSEGKPWELHIIENGPHINNEGYIYWMNQAVDWIQNIWNQPKMTRVMR